jgi:aspartyl/asparaginyl beta-hydroxylase (cupin superfamily)
VIAFIAGAVVGAFVCAIIMRQKIKRLRGENHYWREHVLRLERAAQRHFAMFQAEEQRAAAFEQALRIVAGERADDIMALHGAGREP